MHLLCVTIGSQRNGGARGSLHGADRRVAHSRGEDDEEEEEEDLPGGGSKVKRRCV